MLTLKRCTKLREKLYELLVEPETAPRKLLNEWISHCSSCLDCVDFFIQRSQEQKMVHSMLQQLNPDQQESLLQTSALSSNLPPKQSLRGKRNPISYWPFWSIAAVLGLFSILGWKGEYKNVSSKEAPSLSVLREAQFTMIWDSLLQTIQSKQNTKQGTFLCSTTSPQWEQEGIQMMKVLWEKQIFEKITSDQLFFFAEQLFWHLQKTRQEFKTIADLTRQYEREQQGQPSPFLSRRINLYCRLALMNSEIQTLPELEKQGYPPSKIQQLFENPIHELAGEPGYENQWIIFFQQSSRPLQNIWLYRNLFLREIGVESVEKLGGELEILALVDQLESLINPF